MTDWQKYKMETARAVSEEAAEERRLTEQIVEIAELKEHAAQLEHKLKALEKIKGADGVHK